MSWQVLDMTEDIQKGAKNNKQRKKQLVKVWSVGGEIRGIK